MNLGHSPAGPLAHGTKVEAEAMVLKQEKEAKKSKRRRWKLGLLGQFIIASIVVVVAIGFGLGWLAGRTIEAQAVAELADEARETLASRVETRLTKDDLQQPMTGAQYNEFLRFVDESIRSERTVRIKVWNEDAQVIFSDDREQVGQLYPDNEHFQIAAGGETISHLSGTTKSENAGEQGHGRLLEVYTPIVLSGSSEPAGALEIYQDYGAVAGHIEKTRLLTFAGLGGGLAILWITLVVIVANGARTITRQHDSLVRTQARADTDSLTGVYNHGFVQQFLDRQIKARAGGGSLLSIILLDLDKFKLFNDLYGHLHGDNILKRTAEALKGISRDTDIVGRYGGDEFMLILPGADKAQASLVAERIVNAIDNLDIQPEGGVERLPLTVSGGIAVYPDDSHTKDGLIAHADAGLYQSKQFSGSRITPRRDGATIEGARHPVDAFGVLDGLVRAVDRKDHYTKAHSDADSRYALLLARALGLSEESQQAVRVAGLLHDVGKIGIPDEILMKPGPLTAEEFNVMRQHVLLTERIIGAVPHLPDVRAAAVNHHERYDGAGYPQGLRGEEIPLLGRILAVADGYSAMTLDRPYRKAMTPAAAIRELRAGAGTQFDPHLVEVFTEALRAEGELEETAAVADPTRR